MAWFTAPGTINFKPFTNLNEADLLADLQVNLLGAVRVLQLAFPALKKSPSVKSLIFQGDYYILRAALENLLQNALDFSPENSTIEIFLATFGKELTIAVKDQGLGFPHYALEKAFDRFYSHRPAESGTKGSGLGLTFVREAAQLHRGRATIENHPQGGAVVTVHLPLG